MAARIEVLQQTLINKIAAGEVIVRPASVIKETVENSFDAGAEHIRVEVGGDCRSISIIDDGCGMSEEDARRSILRHSTSKIREFDDLERLATRGFRGEALASIVSVSRFEMLTREKGALAGVRLAVSGGRVERVEPVGTAEGTTLHVRDLFYNVPARLKFLKSAASEFRAIMSVLVPQTLSRPEVGVCCVRAGDVKFDVPARQDLRSRIEDILGDDVRGNLIAVDFERDGLRVRGYAGRPDVSGRDRRRLFLTINGRPIDAQPLSFPIQEAYKGLLMKGRFPVVVLDIAMNPDEVDVNVHPTKEEVRFREERKVGGLLYRAIEAALAGADLTPALDLADTTDEDPPQRPPALGGHESLPNAQSPRSGHSGPLPTSRPTGGASRDASGADPSLPFVFSPKGVQPFHAARDLRRLSGRGDRTPSMFPTSQFVPGAEEPPALRPGQTHGDASASRCQGAPREAGPLDAAGLNRLSLGDGPAPRALGQIAYSYILAEWGEDLLLIDQHAAHERLLYQDLKARKGGEVASQMLMVPVPFGVSAEDGELARQMLPVLREMGMEVAETGPGSFAVSALPSDLDSLDVTSVVNDVLDDLRDETGRPRQAGLDEMRDRVLVRMACHGAVKAGQVLSPEEIDALLRGLAGARMSFTCPHGRPTAIRLTKDQIDRQFGRKG